MHSPLSSGGTPALGLAEALQLAAGLVEGQGSSGKQEGKAGSGGAFVGGADTAQQLPPPAWLLPWLEGLQVSAAAALGAHVRHSSMQGRVLPARSNTHVYTPCTHAGSGGDGAQP